MIKEFQKIILNEFVELKTNKFLLAVSGGIDSMVLANLFHKLKYNFVIAHCNFNLRGDDSKKDELLVKRFANQKEIKLSIKKFKTKDYAKSKKTSIQIAARELRYQWFFELMKTNKIEILVTAHNLNDQFETILINISRGTGFDGITGMNHKSNHIFRPLISFTRSQIEKYAIDNKVDWREDLSNLNDKYLRNFIRNNILKKWMKYDNDLFINFRSTVKNLNLAKEVLKCNLINWKKKNFKKNENFIIISTNELSKLNPLNFYLFELFKDYGFKNTKDLVNITKSNSGKKLLSQTHILLKDRNKLILQKKEKSQKNQFYWDGLTKDLSPLNLKIVKNDSCNKNHIVLDNDKLKFPLEIRKWKNGDYFYPDGIDGKKKVSKYYKDSKLNLFQKEAQWLLCSNNKIVWIVGLRGDKRFKFKSNSKNKLIIKCTV
tara:strand:+ start:422 stop:1717 length:1296 start_codon:yes stop_codon:yes gene_type:complete